MKWYGRIGYDSEGIVREHEFKTMGEALAYKQGALDMKEQSDITDEGVLEDHWAISSNEKSYTEDEWAAMIKLKAQEAIEPFKSKVF